MAESTEKKIRKFLQVGTLECMIFGVVLAIIVAILFMTIGFWKTLLVVAVVAVALFITGVKDKKAFVGKAVGKIAPQRDSYPAKSAKREELEQKVRETVNKVEDDAEEAADEIAEDAEEAAEEIQDKAEELQDKAEETVAAAEEKAEDLAEEVKQEAEALKDQAADAAEAAQEKAENTVEAVQDALKGED